MDTRFWGPSGWKLLHHAALVYQIQNKEVYRKFFKSVPYILPCKYCRTSLTDYYEELPINLSSRPHLIKWLYHIHNCVNNKLRSQNLLHSKNPTFESVLKQQRQWLKDPSIHVLFWDFLFAVAYNHPKEASRHSEPMKGCPEDALTCSNPCIQNKWNVLPCDQRMIWYEQFWNTLPAVLGQHLESEWRKAEATTGRDIRCRRSTLAWLWRMRCAMDKEFHDPYTAICQRVRAWSSDCGKGRRRTCRRSRKI